MQTSRRTFIAGLAGAAVAAMTAACAADRTGEGARSAPSSAPCEPGPLSGLVGINYAWPDDHQGGQVLNWLGAGHPAEVVEHDLAVMSGLGLTSVRAFCQLESIMSFDGERFDLVSEHARNLHHFLDLAESYGMSVLPVITESHVNAPVSDLDGKFRWDLVTSARGRAVYGRAFEAYVREFGRHENVLMWETQNEPYGNLTWATVPAELGVTDADAHELLLVAYDAVKSHAGDVPVGFSDLEEDQQDKYRLVADPVRRESLVDDCTDVYSLHIYRNLTSQIADLSGLTSKPKWCVELGAYNYEDPTGDAHGGQPASNDLYDETTNHRVLEAMIPHLAEMGFDLLMPWSFANNGGMVEHLPDGSHELGSAAEWIQSQMAVCA